MIKKLDNKVWNDKEIMKYVMKRQNDENIME